MSKYRTIIQVDHDDLSMSTSLGADVVVFTRTEAIRLMALRYESSRNIDGHARVIGSYEPEEFSL